MMDTQVIERTKRKYHGSDWDVSIHQTDHGYGKRRRISARQDKKQEACSKCPGCRIDRVLNSTKRPRRSVTSSKIPNKRKRKRSTAPDPIKPSAENPEKMNLAPWSQSAISPADPPVVSNVPCADDLCQVPNSTKRPRCSATSSKIPNKRKRSTVPDPIKPSAENPEKMNLAPRSRSAISPADPPVVSNVPCADDLFQVLNLTKRPRRSVTSSEIPNKRKRKRSTVPDPIKPSAEYPVDMNLAPWSRSAISSADLPVVSNVPLRPEPSSTDHQLSSTDVSHDGPLKIHNYSVEEYQHIYHSVVDEMLRFKSGRMRPYTLALGRKIKQRLWEKLDRPVISTSANDDGHVNVITSYGVGVNPPLHDVDIFGEPAPPKKRARTKNLN